MRRTAIGLLVAGWLIALLAHLWGSVSPEAGADVLRWLLLAQVSASCGVGAAVLWLGDE